MKNTISKHAYILLATLILFSLSNAAIAQREGWKLVWGDEFNTDGHPDSTKWVYEHGFIRNEEAQYYTNRRLRNTRCENGKLILEAHRESFKNEFYEPGSSSWAKSRGEAEYTAGSIKTRGKFSQQYGRFEISAKLPLGRGIWPAFWMMGDKGWWPKCGEIDVMEYVGFEPDVIHANVHWFDYSKKHHTSKGNTLKQQSPGDGFHIYAVEWDATQMKFFYDDKVYHTWDMTLADAKEGNPFHQPHYMLLNLAVGGAWGGQKGIDNAIFPQRYEIDFVRVYKKAE